MNRRVIVMLSLLILGSVACTAVSTPTPTTESIAADVVTLPPRPTMTVTALSTEVFVEETAVIVPSRTPTSQPTATATLLPTPTPRNLPELIWFNEIKEKVVIDSRHSAWSPVKNEILFDNCSYAPSYMLESQTISIASAPNFELTNLNLTETACPFMTEYTWHPDGERVLFSGVPLPAEDDFFSDIWIFDRNNQEVRNLDRLGKFLEFLGWLDSDTLVYRDHWGAANWRVYFLDIKADKELASAYIHGSSVNTFTTDYAVGNDISSEASSSAVSLSREIVNPESQYSPYIKVLSRDFADSCCEYAFNSVALELLPETNQVLIRTWDASEYLTNTISIETDLQLWDIETDELTMLIPDGIDGKFSPNGRFLAYQLFGEENPPLYLLDRNSGEILFVETAKYSSESFSPNGRFLTFYSPTPELMIYDLESGEFLPPILGVPFTILWSPDNSRFVYKDANNGLSIYEVETQKTYPLAASGGERLLDPQWSFDGTYLSVVIHQADGEAKTAVLQLP